jgi:hypothetical protein
MTRLTSASLRPASLSRARCSSSRLSSSPNLFQALWYAVSLRIMVSPNLKLMMPQPAIMMVALQA